MNEDICVGCCDKILQNQMTTYSSLSSTTDDYILCPICAKIEENSINLKGTNFIPDLFRIYKYNLQNILRQ